MAYADETKVPVSKTRVDLESLDWADKTWSPWTLRRPRAQ